MRSLYYFPWCALERQAGPITLIPHRVTRSVDSEAIFIDRILGMYRDPRGRPVREATILRYQGKHIFANLNELEVGRLYDWSSIICFSALSTREYDGLSYWNSANFEIRSQEVPDDLESLSAIRIDIPRKGHVVRSAWTTEDFAIGAPLQISGTGRPWLDSNLIRTFEVLEKKLLPRRRNTWTRWLDAIRCYNEANTDSSGVTGVGVPRRIDLLLMSSAFERLLGVKSNKNDLAKSFEKVLDGFHSVRASDTGRTLSPAVERETHDHWISRIWMKEFYNIRSDYAHGMRDTAKNHGWSLSEHEFIATLAFPLVGELILSREAGCTVTDVRRLGELAALERIMSAPREQWDAIRQEQRLESSWSLIGEQDIEQWLAKRKKQSLEHSEKTLEEQ